MSDAFYTDLQGIVNDLLPQFKQGTILLRRYQREADPSPSKVGAIVSGDILEEDGDTLTTEGGEELSISTPEEWELAAAVPREVPKKYINGTSIVEGDLLVVSAVKALSPSEPIDPQMTDLLVVGGKEMTIKVIKQVPLIGIPVSFLIFVQG